MKYLYYPGCSLKGTARDYEESLLALAPALGIELQELEDWKCCGSSAAKAKDTAWADSLAASTLALSGDAAADLLMPCSACYANHLEFVRRIQGEESLREKLSLHRVPKVKHLLEVLAFDIGAEEIQRRVVRSLKGLRVLPYYGCLVVRPFPLGERDSCENPMALEGLIHATGAHPLHFPQKVDCCGGSLLFSNEKVALRLCGGILREASRLSPDCVVVVCPLCQFMLDGKQAAVEQELGEKFRLPILYLTQLIGLALALDPKKLGIHRLIVSSRTMLSKLGIRTG